MVKVAESDPTPHGYYEKPGGAELPQELKDAVNHLRSVNGISNKVVIVPDALHEAYTNMQYISLSGEYMAMGMNANYHGYAENRLREDLDFVIQHEIGHLNVHPSVSYGWKKEIAMMPVEGRKKGPWANVLSDIIVNYAIANGAQLPISGTEKVKETKRMNGAVWSAYGGGFRNCMDGEGSLAGQYRHRELLDARKLVDNRYHNGVYDPHAVGNEYLASPDTPEYQKWQGHGRGPQLYPSVSWCLSHKMPIGTDMGVGTGASRTSQDYPDNWKQIKVLADVNIEYSPSADKWLGYNPTPGVCPLTSAATTKEGPISSGTYTALACRTYDGIENPTDVRPIEFFQIDVAGKPRWIPAHYTISLCPHCGMTAPSQFQIAMAFRPGLSEIMADPSIADGDTLKNIEKSQLYNVLLNYLIAGLYATSLNGYGSKTGPEAGHQFLNDVAWDRHLCMIGR